LGRAKSGTYVEDPESGDSESDEAMYDNIDANIIDADWVASGPLSATIKLWSRKSEGMPNRREEPIVRLLPPRES
jgi:hypothetical protein